MKRNVSGQKIGAQLVNATTGAAFTGAVTVSVTGDAGTQATGSVGAGACTHEGGGYHTYAPATAETDYDLIAFTFAGTGAVPVTLQVYTTFPQTGDNFARIGAAGAGLTGVPWNATWDTEVQSEVADALTAFGAATAAAITALNNLSAAQVRTELSTELGRIDVATSTRLATAGYTAPPSAATNASAVRTELSTELGRVDAATSTRATPAQVATELAGIVTSLTTIAGYLDTEIAAIKAKTDALPTDPADESLIQASITALAASVATLATYVDTEVAAVKAKTDQLAFTSGAVNARLTRLGDVAVEGEGTPADRWRPA